MENKKATELALQTIVIFILGIVVLLFIIIYFTGSYVEGSETILETGTDIIESYEPTQ